MLLTHLNVGIRLIISSVFLIFSCSNSKKEAVYEPSNKLNPYDLYKEGLDAFEINDYFFAGKKFPEAELNFRKYRTCSQSLQSWQVIRFMVLVFMIEL